MTSHRLVENVTLSGVKVSSALKSINIKLIYENLKQKKSC